MAASRKKKSSAATHFPFPYYGEGSATPIREKDGLVALLVFETPLSSDAARSVVASLPPPMRTRGGENRRWLFLQSTDRTDADVRAWARDSGVTIGKSSSAAYAHLAKALTAWATSVHASHPVALFFVGSDGKRGPWHADTVKQFGARVRPVIDMLRKAGAKDHAHWIAVSFLRSGAKTSFDDIRRLADEDPVGFVGNIGRRCLLAWPLVEQVGAAGLSEMGPYAELGFWACASISELVPDPAEHAAHLAALADACPAKRRPAAVQHLLVRAASSMMRDQVPLMVKVERPARAPRPRVEAFDAAMSVARAAAAYAPLTVGYLEDLVDASRVLGGAPLAVAMAKPFLAAAIDVTPKTRDDNRASQEIDRLHAFAKALADDLAKAPDAEVSAALAHVPAAEPIEEPIKGASHPHLARLNAERLSIRYRGSSESQTVVIDIKGSSQPSRAGASFRRMRDVVSLVDAGLAGAAVFAPELGELEVLKGPAPDDSARDTRWTLRARGIAPSFWAVALHFLASAGEWYEISPSVRECPKHIDIVGALPVDASSASVTIESMIDWLRKPAPAFLPYPEPPFEVRAPKSASTAILIKPARMTKAVEAFVEDACYQLKKMLAAYPMVGRIRLEHPTFGKTQAKIAWAGTAPATTISRGPLLNMARRLHVRVGGVTEMELA
jgi:hypothetical protein